MKKLVSLVLVLAMVLSICPAVFAIDATTLDATILPSTHIVNVYGQFEGGEGTLITFLLVDDAKNIKHIAEAELEKDNSYRAKFKYPGDDFESLKLRVKCGNNDITDTVISAVAAAEPISYQINVTNANGKILLDTKIENIYNVPDKTYTVMLAYYDENKQLLDVYTQDTKDIEFETSESPKVEYNIPEDATNVKVFVWDKTSTMVPLTNEYEVKTKDDVRVLVIGHSFVEDSINLLEKVAEADGVKITVDYLLYGGGSFLHHWNTWNAEYETEEEAKAAGASHFRRRYHHTQIKDNLGNNLTDEFGENVTGFTKTADDFLKVYDYDYVAMLTTYGILPYDAVPQKNYAGYPGSEDDIAGQNMAKYIRECQPDAEILIINTWAYEKESTGHIGTGQYIFGYGPTFDQDKMWEQVRKTVEYQTQAYAKLTTDDGAPISLDGKPLKYIPSGQAFNNARKSLVFDTKYYHGYTNKASANFEFVDVEHPEYKTLHRDSYHCSRNYGRYLASLVFYGTLTGNSPTNNKFVHPESKWRIPDDEAQILREAAKKAIDDSGIWN